MEISPVQVNRVNVGGTEYCFGSSRARATCNSESDAAVKVISIPSSFTVEEGVCISVKFEHGNTYGNVHENYVYSQDDGKTFYSDSECTVLAELAPVDNRYIVYSGTANIYNYYVFPVIQIDGLGKIPVCDCRGHYAGKGCWNDGDKITFYLDGEAALIQNTDIRQTEDDFWIKSDGSKEYRPSVIDSKATSLRTSSSNASVLVLGSSNGEITRTTINNVENASKAGSSDVSGRNNYGITFTITLGSKDNSLWYPIIMPLSTLTETRIHVDETLEGIKPSWAAHSNGFVTHQHFTALGGGWGTNSNSHLFYNLDVNNTMWINDGTVPVSWWQSYRTSTGCLWLRGGGWYHVHVDGYYAGWNLYDSFTDGYVTFEATSTYPEFGRLV